LSEHPVQLVVDPVMIASSGARLLQEDAVAALVSRLFPLADVVTPNEVEARLLVGDGPKGELAERLVELGAPAAIVTGGHGLAGGCAGIARDRRRRRPGGRARAARCGVNAGADLALIRERKPLVHQITNFVVMNETANATLAIGALPVMAHALQEVEEMARAA